VQHPGHANIGTVKAGDVQEYVNRDWEMIERAKMDHWIDQNAAMTPSALFELSGELLEYARAMRPDWPDAAERRADLDAHIHLTEKLYRAWKTALARLLADASGVFDKWCDGWYLLGAQAVRCTKRADRASG